MYLSHPVRRMRDDPIPDASVTLVVTTEDEADTSALAADLSDLGTVEDRLRFGSIRVTLPEDRVAAVCSLEGIESVETAGTLAMDPDGAGEDVDFGDR